MRVVGIGASAGGLDAIRRLVTNLPVKTGLAFVVIQHLPPTQIGQLARLLVGMTKLPVIEVKSGQRVRPDTIYVVPSRTTATLQRGELVLRPTTGRAGGGLPIDLLFTSLATAIERRAIGVVLSGSGGDGSLGLRAIRAAGGHTFAQDPSTAQFDEMPRSAIAAGVAHTVAPPAQIADDLAGLGRVLVGPDAAREQASAPIDSVLARLRDSSGVDFTSYKRATIERRLARRITKHGLRSLDDYGNYLDSHPDEGRAVYEDLLVHATGFFRDGPLLERLVAQLVPHLAGRPSREPVRAWVPGCATGEEVYSLAMLLVEAVGSRPVQLFGSDLSERAIETARAGRYPLSIAAQVGAERISQFFHRDEDSYRVHRDLRDRCVFVHHDLVSDPPISKLDLVSCRDVLIYLQPELQKRLIPLFHYALNQPGFLMLGRGEVIAGCESLFDSVDPEASIFAPKPVVRTSLTFPLAAQLGRQPSQRRNGTGQRLDLELQRDVDHVLLARYAPPSVIVDDNFDVTQFRGRTGQFLEVPSGQLEANILKLAREPIAAELRLAIQRARASDAPARKDNLSVSDHGRVVRFDLEVIPLRSAGELPRHYLVTFVPVAEPVRKGRRGAATQGAVRGEAARLREELAAAKEYLSTLVVQHRSTSEELGIANEELQSTNEELQSTNEELQSAKEELQSTNEELETLNAELDARLREANDDVLNAFASVEIAVIMVDTERRVRRFTPRARAVMKLIPGDIGRPISDLKPSLPLPGLDEAIVSVIETLVVEEREVSHADGTSYRMQIRPYRTADHKVAGAVVTFVDITSLRAAREHAAAIVEAVPTPLAVIDRGMHVRTANQAFRAEFGAAPLGRSLFDLGEWRSPDLGDRIAAAFESGEHFDDLEIGFTGTDGERTLHLGTRSLPGAADRGLLLLGVSDITEQRSAENARRVAAAEHDAFLDAVSHELRTPLSAILLWGQALRELPPDDPGRHEAVEAIIESAQAEAHLVDDLLELALSRSGQLSVALEPIDALTVIDAVVSSVRKEAADKEIVLEAELPKTAPVNADPRRLRQIVSSLLGNALKFTPTGGTVSISVDVDGPAMEICVRDSGDGIPPEFLSHVFEPFSQVDRSRTRSHRGLGIGLALVRHLVVRQRGTIDVASAGRGHGTTFTVRMPLLGSAST